MEHTRIDEGVKRGPRKPTLKPKVNLTVVKRPMKDIAPERRTEIANAVIARYIHGEQVAEIAKDYDTSDVTIYALLLRDHEETWADVQRARAMARFERSLTDIAVAADALSLGRARELHKSAQFELERLLNRLYGQQTHVTMEITGDLGDRLRRSKERVIEHDAPQQSGQAQITDVTELSHVIESKE